MKLNFAKTLQVISYKFKQQSFLKQQILKVEVLIEFSILFKKE